MMEKVRGLEMSGDAEAIHVPLSRKWTKRRAAGGDGDNEDAGVHELIEIERNIGGVAVLEVVGVNGRILDRIGVDLVNDARNFFDRVCRSCDDNRVGAVVR